MNKSNTKPVGGSLYLCLNTAGPFGEDIAQTHVPCHVQARPFQAIKFP